MIASSVRAQIHNFTINVFTWYKGHLVERQLSLHNGCTLQRLLSYFPKCQCHFLRMSLKCVPSCVFYEQLGTNQINPQRKQSVVVTLETDTSKWDTIRLQRDNS